jgi:uncharacterized membrane protein
MKTAKLAFFPLIILTIATGVLIQATPGMAASGDQDKPARSIGMAFEYPGISIPQGENVTMDLIFSNKGRSDENVVVRMTDVPLGWDAKVKTYRYTVSGVHVPSGEDKMLTFEASPDESVQPGDYTFRAEAQTPDGRFKMAQSLHVKVLGARDEKQDDRGVKLTTSYPVIRGPSDAAFEFSLEVDSKLDQDAVFDLFAQGPEGWEINFKPAYESKYITSLRLKANQTQSIAVEVKPAMDAQASEYPINIRVSSGDAKGEAQLRVILTGTYGLEVGTANGLLSLQARQGRPANISFYIRNRGTAANHGIKFLTFKPENWEVTFTPDTIDVIEPGDLKQIEMTITPYEEALIGDYSVGVRVEGEKATEDIEFRTTVKASTVWGWIGIGIIVAAIAGLFVLFRWLGRR